MNSLRREHFLPERLTVHCMRCGSDTDFSVDQLAEDGEGPLLDSPLRCRGCGNDVDARIERDLRVIADATVSLRTFLPPGRLMTEPKREKAWGVSVHCRLLPG